MKSSSNTPVKILIHQELCVPPSLTMVLMSPSASTPSSDPRTYFTAGQDRLAESAEHETQAAKEDGPASGAMNGCTLK
jgi:hypothetical protein